MVTLCNGDLTCWQDQLHSVSNLAGTAGRELCDVAGEGCPATVMHWVGASTLQWL
jgi:hypothetical protein